LISIEVVAVMFILERLRRSGQLKRLLKK